MAELSAVEAEAEVAVAAASSLPVAAWAVLTGERIAGEVAFYFLQLEAELECNQLSSAAVRARNSRTIAS